MLSHRKQSEAFCHEIAQDPLLVQGAGGNMSWKDGRTLWVKASGTWLSDSLNTDIFVPVDLDHLQINLKNGHYAFTPRVLMGETLRPSIETILHGLMSHKIVLHLHALHALVYLIQHDAKERLADKLQGLAWLFIDYHKPGEKLAENIALALAGEPDSQILMLQNHGIVIAGDTIDEVGRLLSIISTRLLRPQNEQLAYLQKEVKKSVNFAGQPYFPIENPLLNQLVYIEKYCQALKYYWAICPDHVVFLGHKANVFTSESSLIQYLNEGEEIPELVFIEKSGVFVTNDFSEAKLLQLQAYFDLISRVENIGNIKVLSEQDIAALLNWDAEHYRQQLQLNK